MRIVVSKDEELIRLDMFLTKNLEESRSNISKHIKDGTIKVNGNVVKTGYLLREGDLIEYEEWCEVSEVVPEDIPLDIYYEDESIIVVNKKSGMVVHPGNGNNNGTLANALMFHTNNLSDINGMDRPGIVHRIDKDTSGLLLIAKTNKAHEILAEDFKEKRVKREYIALLNGVFKQGSATIDAPIGRDKNFRERMCVTAENSKNAVTHMKVLKRYSNHTLVSCILDTGRTHQIRVHMAYIGYPVYNDPVYAKKEATSFGQFLHSYKMKFVHPITKKEMEFEAPLPLEFKKFLETID